MSIAQTGTRGGAAQSIGDLLPGLQLERCEGLSLELPEPLTTREDRVRWARIVEGRLNALPAVPDAAVGKEVRTRIFRAASFLERQGTVSHPSTRCHWRNVVSLLKVAACDADFWSPTGPLIGIGDAKLQDKTGLQNTTRLFRELAKHGLVIAWNAKSNGRRGWHRRKDGTVAGSGYSLAPLLFLIDAVELLVDEERERLRSRVTLPEEINASLALIRRVLAEHDLADPFVARMQNAMSELAAERDNARRGRLERLVAAADRARHLAAEAEKAAAAVRTAQRREENCPVQRDESVPAYTNENLTNRSVEGLAGGRSGDGGPSTETSSDRFGITRSGFEWREAPHLFPFVSGMVSIEPANLRRTAFALGRIIQVQPNTIDRAVRSIGIEAATICLLLTGQHQAMDQIRRTPEIYFRGLLARARQDDLNIGHSLFGRREQVGSHRPRSADANRKRERNQC
ncbi:replication initiation protein RepC [Qipengyuania citrea]|uniref:replication initiation protein RepC n=1 Tax=Qipengyuania citrea TaxID=225971 RepID=UPI0032968052